MAVEYQLSQQQILFNMHIWMNVSSYRIFFSFWIIRSITCFSYSLMILARFLVLVTTMVTKVDHGN